MVRPVHIVALLALTLTGCSLFADTNEVALREPDSGLVDDAQNVTDAMVDSSAPEMTSHDTGSDADLGRDQGRATCVTTSDCPGGTECLQVSPATPGHLECADVACGCGPDAWCDGSRCWDVAPCTDSTQCQGGEVCLSDLICSSLCIRNGECGPGFDCASLRPHQVADPDDAGLFTCQPASCRCENDEDRCESGRCVHATAECTADPCPPPAGRYSCDESRGACVCDGPDCVRDCDADTDCAAFETCDTASATCFVVDCFDDDDCTDGRICGFVKGIGRACAVPGPEPTGAACTSPADCSTSHCEAGVCLPLCLGQADCGQGEACQTQGMSTASCVRGGGCNLTCNENAYCAPTLLGGTGCFIPCQTTAECTPSGEVCGSLFPGSAIYPTPYCTRSEVECDDDEVVDMLSGECRTACLDDADCPSADICVDYVCATPCTQTCDCEPTEQCAPWGTCIRATQCNAACDPDAWCTDTTGMTGKCGLDIGKCQ